MFVNDAIASSNSRLLCCLPLLANSLLYSYFSSSLPALKALQAGYLCFRLRQYGCFIEIFIVTFTRFKTAYIPNDESNSDESK